jgi:hypothetical protein
MPQLGDIVFVRGTSLISRLIRKLDGGEYSHVTMMVTDTDSIEAMYNTTCKIKPFDDSYQYEVLRLHLSDEQKSQILEIAKTLEGKRYDFLQVLGILLKAVFKKEYTLNSPNRFICTEAVVTILEEIGAIEKGAIPIEVTPNELMQYIFNYRSRRE